MLQLTTTQQDAINSSSLFVVWLFEVTAGATTYRWATTEITFSGYSYSARIIKESFAGITERRRCHEDGRWTSTECSFGVEAVSSDIDPEDFEDSNVVIRLVVNNVEIRNWHFKTTSVGKAYKRVTFYCIDLLTHYLNLSEYPNSRLIKDLFVDKNAINDTMCAPIPFGSVYIPLRPVWCTPTGQPTGRYYLLGPDSYNYAVSKIRSPREYPSKYEWTSGFSIYTADSHKVLLAEIADTNADGVADAQGLWWTNKLLDAPVAFYRSDTASTTNPGDVLQYILQDFGISSTYIDTSIKTIYNTWGLAWAGAIAFKQPRSSLIARLLVQCASVLDPQEQVTLRTLDKSSVATITSESIVSRTFSYVPAGTSPDADSGYIAWQDAGEPWDSFNQLVVPVSTTTQKPSTITYLMDFVHNQAHALALGQLALQRTLGIVGYARCVVLQPLLALQPYDVVTISGDLYWPGTYEIEEVRILQNGQIDLSLRRYGHSLNNFTDLSPTARTPSDPTDNLAWTVVASGPDSVSGQLPNAITGRLSLGSSTNNRIVLDPEHPSTTGPVIELLESGNTRLQIGKLGSSNYGFVTYSAGGDEIIRIDSSVARICGWNMDANKIYQTGLEIDAANRRIKAYNSSNMVVLSNQGLTGYDATLGYTFKIPTDGSAPEFSSGIIKECEYEIYTSGVIKTSANPASSGGVLINSTGIKGYNASGALKFKLDATSGTLWATDAQISGAVTVGSGSSVPWDYVSGTGKPEDNATNDSSWRHSSDTTRIDGGKVYVGSSLVIGSSAAGGRIIINSSKTGYADGVAGVFLGYSSGWKFEIYGNASNYIRWDGSTFYIRGRLTTESYSNISWSSVSGTGCPEDNATDNSGWRYTGAPSYMDGGMIYQSTITASKLKGSAFGTLTISSGTIIIESGEGLTVRNSAALILAGSSPYSYKATFYVNTSGDLYIYTNQGDIELDFNGNLILYWASPIGGSTVLIASSVITLYKDIYPASANSVDIGTSTYYLASIYSNYVYYRYASTFDTLNDLAVIKSLDYKRDNTKQPITNEHGSLELDIATAPIVLTNAENLAHELTIEYKKQITTQDIEDLKNGKTIQTQNGDLTWADIKDRLFFNLPAMTSLCLGAIKQISDKIDNMHQRISNLESMV